jgi:hypothetical protein
MVEFNPAQMRVIVTVVVAGSLAAAIAAVAWIEASTARVHQRGRVRLHDAADHGRASEHVEIILIPLTRWATG